MQIYDNIDFVVMQKIYTERRCERISSVSTRRFNHNSRRRSRGPGPALQRTKRKGEDYYEAEQSGEQPRSELLRHVQRVVRVVEEFQYVEEMLGPDKPDWETLLDNLAWQMMTNSARYGTDHNFTANTMPFQVFVGEDNPTDEEAELGKPGYKIRADPKQDDTYVINRPSSDALDMPRMAKVVSRGDSTTNKKRVLALRIAGHAAAGEGLQPSKVSRSEHKDRQGVRHVLEQVQVRELRGDCKRLHVTWSQARGKTSGRARLRSGEAAEDRAGSSGASNESQPHSVYGSSEVTPIALAAGKKPRFVGRKADRRSATRTRAGQGVGPRRREVDAPESRSGAGDEFERLRRGDGARRCRS